jgi:hypothetical protein
LKRGRSLCVELAQQLLVPFTGRRLTMTSLSRDCRGS